MHCTRSIQTALRQKQIQIIGSCLFSVVRLFTQKPTFQSVCASQRWKKHRWGPSYCSVHFESLFLFCISVAWVGTFECQLEAERGVDSPPATPAGAPAMGPVERVKNPLMCSKHGKIKSTLRACKCCHSIQHSFFSFFFFTVPNSLHWCKVS